MKTESLHALVMDHQAGELPSEVAELLESYLASNPEARAESEQLLNVMEVTRQTVIRYPELARTFDPVTTPEMIRISPPGWPGWLKIAALVVFAALMAMGGYHEGSGRALIGFRDQEQARTKTETPRKDSPWARYRMQTDLVGKIQVVRVDAERLEGRP